METLQSQDFRGTGGLAFMPCIPCLQGSTCVCSSGVSPRENNASDLTFVFVRFCLFVQNYVVDQLGIEYPGLDSEEKYHIARLCVSALMAKIHTIEWTPTLLQNPSTSIGLNANWRGAEEVLVGSSSCISH